MFVSLAGCQRDIGVLRPSLAPLGLHTQAAPGGTSATESSTPPADAAAGAVIVRGTPVQPRLAAPGDAADPQERRDIQISFTDTALKTVVDTLLGDILNLPYTYDPRVQGTVSLHTGRQMSSTEVLRLLETLLRMNGAALVRAEGLYRVVPLADARAGSGAPAASGGPGYAVSALPLRYVSATTMQQLLEPIYQASGQVQIDAGLNLLLVVGTADERRSIIDAARGFDVDWMAGRSVGIFPLSQSRPEPVIRELETIFAAGDKGIAAGAVTFLPVQRLNGVLAVANTPSIIDKVSAWIERLDHGTANQRNLFVYYVQHAKARDIALVLTRLFDGGGSETEPAAPSRVTPAGRPTVTLETSGGSPGGGLATPAPADAMPFLSARPPAAGKAEVEAQPPGGVRIIADAPSNTLVILAFPQEYKLIEQALHRLDVAPQQVLIEATIAEVTLNDRLRYGVQTYLKSDSGDVQGGFTLAQQALRPITQTPGFNLLVSRYGDPRGVLTALDEITDVKVVSSPQLVVMDNQEAQLQVGDRVPVITRQAVSTDNPSAPVVNSVEYQNTGVILRVTPRINAGGMVTMDIQQEVSSVSRSANTGALTPTISRRAIESNVSIRSGQTVVLGGLISDQQTVGSSGLPGLSRIPVLGALFGEKTNGLQRTELIVFITPRVVRNPDDAEAVTQELMRRLRGLAPPPGVARTTTDP